ncbi:MAG TPA: PfaB family protein, partial [Chloroflexota bacterium]|nr:PfaB family protein [Chloroflexota bacterium]
HAAGAPDVPAYERLLHAGRSALGSVPAERWKGIERSASTLGAHGLPTGAPHGAYLSGFDVDFLRYRIPPNDDDQPIPQQLLLLTTADEAIRDAGLREGGAVAVVVAMETELELHRYRGRVELEWQVRDALRAAGIALDAGEERALAELAKDALSGHAQVNRYASFIGNIMATRVASQWDFNGPAFTLSEGPRSAHRAVELAQLLLAQGDVDAVVVAGVSLAGSPEAVLLRARLGLGGASPPADGAAALVLRPAGASGATDAASRVYATIDPAFGPGDSGASDLAGAEPFDVPSSVAAEVGAAGAATGVFVLLKAALCLHRRVLPAATAGAGGTWPWLGATGGRAALVRWPDGPSLVLRESVSAAQPPLLDPESLSAGAPHLIPLASESVDGLLADLDALERAVDHLPLAHVASRRCARLLPGAAPAPAIVLALVAGDDAALRKEIERARAGVPGAAARGGEWSTPAGSCFAARPLGGSGDVAFVYSGGISAYPGLGRELFSAFPGLHDVLARRLFDPARAMASDLVYPRTTLPVGEAERAAQERLLVDDAFGVAAAGACFALAATTILRDVFKLAPRVAFGFSLGEASMLLALGIWSGADLAASAARVAPLLGQRISGRKDAARDAWAIAPDVPGDDFWQTYLVLASPADVAAAVADEPRAFMTIVAGPKEVFIAGHPDACQRVIARLRCGHAPAPFNYVLHCPPVATEQAHLATMYRLPVHAVPESTEVRFLSAASDAPLRLDTDEIAQRISEVVCQPLDFAALVERAYAAGARIFVEQGPGRACARWIRAILRDRPHVSVSLNQKGTDDRVSLVRLLACLVAHRVPLDLSPLLPVTVDSAAAPARALIHRIVPGGPPIHDVIVTEANVSRFRQAARRVPVPVPVPAPALVTAPAPAPEPVVRLPRRPASDHAVLALAGGAARATESHTSLVATRHAAARALAAGVQRQLDLLKGHTPPPPRRAVWDQADLLEFAGGEIARVFGPEYAPIDRARRRVRLPLPPYLLVSRVTRIDARRGRYEPSTLTTEYDVPHNAWYAVDGQVPCAVAVESGQCDLLLISYLGIDFENRGERVYRLLDCTLTFLDDLPKEGDTLRYDISINSFARTGDSLLFFFSYECFVRDRLVLKMDGGCAGFFTDDELEQGRGVLYTDSERASRAQRAARYRAENPPFVAPLHSRRRRFAAAAIAALSDGDLAACFGAAHHKHGRNSALRLPPAALRMFDRVVDVDPHGGAWGLGAIVAEKDLRPDDWYFPCHFQGDEVLAGSLMAEGCVQLLQFYLLYLGCHVLVEHARFQPILGLPQVVRCRGQVTPQHGTLTYRMEITELKRTPTPHAVASVEVLVDGKVVVHFENLGLRLAEDPAAPGRALPPPVRTTALLDERHLDAFATGRMADAFGPDFAVYDGRTVSRQPNGDLLLVSRVLTIDGARGRVVPGASLLSEYDVPADPWFHAESAGAGVPYSSLMEVALQPCGILSAWLGSTLQYPDTAFHFRNLDGSGRLLDRLDVRGRTIRNEVRLVSSTALPGVIIQKFTFRLSCDGRPFYEGDASFGHFEDAALAQQIGLDSGALTDAWHDTHPPTAGSQRVTLDVAPTGGHFDLLDRLVIDPNGGTHGQGCVYGSRPVNDADWFYACHFYQDPVMPGSLGVQAMVGALQAFARHQGLGSHLRAPRFGHPAGHAVVWKYRGQIVLTNQEMTLELHVKRVERVGPTGQDVLVVADGSLWRDRLRIYEVADLAITVEESA